MADAPHDLPWWVSSDEELAALPIGAAMCIAAFPEDSPWAWAVGTSAGRIVLHSRGEGEPPSVVTGWQNGLMAVAIDPEGHRVAGLDRAGELQIADVSGAGGGGRWSPAQPDTGIDGRWALAFSPDGAALASVARGVLTVRPVDEEAMMAEAGRETSVEAVHALDAVWLDDTVVIHVSPRGGLGSLSAVRWADMETEKTGATTSVGVAGEDLLVAHRDGRVTVRRLATPTDVVDTFWTGVSGIVQVARHADGPILLLTDRGEAVMVEDPRPSREQDTLGVGTALHAAWSSDGTRLALATPNGSVTVRDRTTQRRTTLGRHTSGVRGVAVIDETRVLVGRVGRLGMRVMAMEPAVAPVPLPSGPGSRVAWRPEGDRFFGRETDGPVWVLDGTEQHRTPPSAGTEMSVSGTGAWVAAFDRGSDVVDLHSTDGSRPSRTIQGRLACFAPDRPEVAVVGPGPTIQVYRPGEADPIEVIEVGGMPRAVAWGPPSVGITFAYPEHIGTFEGEMTWTPPPSEPFERLWWNPSGTFLASIGAGRVRVRSPGMDVAPDLPCEQEIYDLDWIDDTTLVVATAGGLAQVFRIGLRGPEWAGALVSWAPGTEGEEEADRHLDPDAPTARRDGGIVDDRPTKDVDHLGARFVAVGLDDLLRRELEPRPDAPDRSVAVNLDAAWGRGKSTVLTHLEDLTEEQRAGRPRWLVVHHDAWRHSRTSPHWWALARDLRQALMAERARTSAKGARRLGRAELWCRITAAVGWPQVVITAGVVLAIALVLGLTDIISTSDGFTSVTALLTFVGAVAAGATLVGGLGHSARRFMRWSHSPGPDALSQTEATPLAQAAAHIRWLRRQALRSDAGEGWANTRPILFAIDELDRCDAATVVEVLDSVHTLMRPDTHALRRTADEPVAPVAFLVLADAAWIRHAYQTVHADQVDAPAGGVTLGTQFHAKLFNLVVPLPPLTPQQHLTYAAATLAQLTGTTLEDAAQRIVDGSDTDATVAVDEPESSSPSPSSTAATSSERPPTQDRPPAADDAVGPSLRQRLIELQVIPPTEALAETAAAKVAARQRHVLEAYAPLLPRNPRALKRVVNDWTVQVVVRGHLAPQETVSDDHMIRWVILAQSWPDLADRLLTIPGLDDPPAVTVEMVVAHLAGPLGETARLPTVQRVWPLLSGTAGREQVDRDLLVAVATLAGRWPPVEGEG